MNTETPAAFEDLLPDMYRKQVIAPTRFEQHEDSAAHAKKIIGWDDSNRRCFYYHDFTLTEEGFDVDEFPLEIDVYYEQVIAWRLQDGKWAKLTTVSDRLNQCANRYITLPLELVDTM